MSKDEADDYKKIEISFLNKYGYLDEWSKWGTVNWSRGGEPSGSVSVSTPYWEKDSPLLDRHVKFSYTSTDRWSGEKEKFDYKVQLTTTQCHFGGVRYWFICPLTNTATGMSCRRRVGVLYLAGKWFGCRHCYDLCYASQKVDHHYKHYPLFRILDLEQKAEKLEKQIKRTHYAGRPTRKYRKLLALYDYERRYYQWAEQSGALDVGV